MAEVPTPATAPPWLTRRRVLTAGALAMVGVVARPSQALSQPSTDFSTTEEAIRQVRVFRAARQRVFEALTVESQFDKIVQLSGVMKSDDMTAMRAPTKLSPQPGSAFALFGGHIVGRQIELVANELIVQAWRPVSWSRGTYSVARFELSDQGGSTKLVFNHSAFPKGLAEHLASGWQANYWDPLTKLLA
jgi:activator of HSP90 ATPase